MLRSHQIGVVVGALALLHAVEAENAHAQVRRFDVVVVPVDFVEEPGTADLDFLNDVYMPGLHDDLIEMSNGHLDLHYFVVPRVTRLPGPRRLYHVCRGDALMPGEECRNMWEPAGMPLEVAVDDGILDVLPEGLAPAGGDADDVFEGVLFLQTVPVGACSYPNSFGGHTFNGQRVAADPNDAHRYEVAYDQIDMTLDCVLNPYDYGGALHELGHQLSGHGGHPAGYNNGWELMDSCYPCSTGAYTRLPDSLLTSGETRYFSGWLPEARVVTHSVDGTSGSEILAAVELPSDLITAPQTVKIETNQGYYYLAEYRTYISPDDWLPIIGETRQPGLMLLRVTPGAGLETEVVPSPAWAPEDGWIGTWSAGEVFYDPDADVAIAFGPTIDPYYFAITTSYGPAAAAAVPDVGIIPWLTAPRFTYETVDIWIDSSCNGYLADAPADSSRLRYGVRADGSGIGNGDDVCLAHENRIYARIRNLGRGTASNVTVRFEVTDPLGVGIWGSSGWNPVGTAPPIASLAAGASADVFVPWVPDAAVFPSEDRFAFHSCVRVIIDAVGGEVALDNQDGEGEQENLQYFELRRETTSYAPAEGFIWLENRLNEPRSFYIESDVDLPDTWSLLIGDGRQQFELTAGERRAIPVKIEVPAGTPIGESYDVRVTGWRLPRPTDPRVPGLRQFEPTRVSGLVIRASTVEATTLGLDAKAIPQPSSISVRGCLSQRVNGRTVTIDYVTPSGWRIPQRVTTNASGCFTGTLFQPAAGLWHVQAMWTGDSTRGAAVSQELDVKVGSFLSDCCTAGSQPQCTYPDVEACVCAADSYCCTTAWDSICVNEVTSLGCGACHDACVTGARHARQRSTETCVCAVDSYCCTTAWDSICVNEVVSLGCGTCSSGMSMSLASGAPADAESSTTSACVVDDGDTSWDRAPGLDPSDDASTLAER